MRIEELIAQGENAAIEFKAADVHPDSLAKEIVAFANTAGGTILIGVNDQGGVSGLHESTDYIAWVANIARNNVIPAIDCSVYYDTLTNNETRMCVVDVPKGKDKPYQTNKTQYLVRVGSTNRVASAQELMRLFQQSGAFHYDATPVSGSNINELNKNLIDKYLRQYDISLADEPSEAVLLHNMDIMVDNELTVAGLLLFGINPQRRLHNASISYAHFVGEKVSDELIDKQVIEGTLPDQIEKTLAIVKHNTKQPSKINGAKTESTAAFYSDKVLRELIVNAVTHRNYSIVGSRIRIMHFDNRLEFISPGRLPNTISVEKLRYGVSYASNPVILKFLENMRYIDKLGRGLPMVYNEAQTLGLQVHFEEIGEEFKVTLMLGR